MPEIQKIMKTTLLHPWGYFIFIKLKIQNIKITCPFSPSKRITFSYDSCIIQNSEIKFISPQTKTKKSMLSCQEDPFPKGGKKYLITSSSFFFLITIFRQRWQKEFLASWAFYFSLWFSAFLSIGYWTWRELVFQSLRYSWEKPWSFPVDGSPKIVCWKPDGKNENAIHPSV